MNYILISRLVPSGSSKNFIFKAGTPQETTKWFHVVRENKDTSEGAKKNLNNLLKYPRFWRVYHNIIFRRIEYHMINFKKQVTLEILFYLEEMELIV